MVDFLNHQASAIAAISTSALLIVTAFYAWVTYRLLHETKLTRLYDTTPRVVAYLRIHEVHSNLVQLCIGNLSRSPACKVSAKVVKVTEWPVPFDLDESTILRDINYLSPGEILRFDMGGPDLFRDKKPAIFDCSIVYSDFFDRSFEFQKLLKVESVTGFGAWQVYGLDDIARRLKDISKTLDSFGGLKKIKVDVFSSSDRKKERDARDAERRKRAKENDG